VSAADHDRVVARHAPSRGPAWPRPDHPADSTERARHTQPIR
jgi:hypothetical protein